MSNISQIIRGISIAFLLVVLTRWSNAGETKSLIFWDTVSPDGKYALGWSTTGSMDPDEIDREESGIKNGLVDVASKKMLLVLPGASYWDLQPNGGHPNHYSMSTVWSDDNASLLAIYDSRYATDQVYLVDVKTMRVKELIDDLHGAFYQAVREKAASYYRKHGKDYAIDFLNPWFVGHDRFEVSGSTFVSKFDEDSVAFALTVQFAPAGRLSTIKSENLGDDYEESDDRKLNRAYRSLIGLLTSDERKALVEEERAWIGQRDAAKSLQAKNDLVAARIGALSDRYEAKIDALRAADAGKVAE
jgi:Lysozyme inhibitor LprI